LTWEFWLKVEPAPTSEACLIDAGEGVFNCTLNPAQRGFVIQSGLMPLRVLAPCDERVWDGRRHHVAFTYSRGR
jgi:hypothetical protein